MQIKTKIQNPCESKLSKCVISKRDTLGIDARSVAFDSFYVQIGVDDRFEWRARYVNALVQYVYHVVARHCGQVAHVTRAVLVVLALDARLARTLHSQVERAVAGTACIYDKVGRLVHRALAQAGTVGLHFARIDGLVGLYSKLFDGHVAHVDLDLIRSGLGQTKFGYEAVS